MHLQGGQVSALLPSKDCTLALHVILEPRRHAVLGQQASRKSALFEISYFGRLVLLFPFARSAIQFIQFFFFLVVFGNLTVFALFVGYLHIHWRRRVLSLWGKVTSLMKGEYHSAVVTMEAYLFLFVLGLSPRLELVQLLGLLLSRASCRMLT